MVKRTIIQIDEIKCDGCGLCIPNCHEGALKIVNGKAKLVNDVYCDGLGDCLGHCPKNAITLIQREAKEFNEKKVKQNKVSCSSIKIKNLKKNEPNFKPKNFTQKLKQWPIKINLVPTNASFLKNSNLLVCADCVSFAKYNFHNEILKNKILLIGCPKFDDKNYYIEKLTKIINENDLQSITVAIMKVPCCKSLETIVQKAIENSKTKIKLNTIIIC
jgi:ferredoxin